MKLKILLFSVLCMLTLSMSAQRSEIGLFGGVSGYSGDLTHGFNSTLVELKFAYGVYYRYSQGRYFSLRGGVIAGGLGGSDVHSDEPYYLRRNLDFTSPIVEFHVMPEFNIFEFPVSTTGHILIPYISTGVAGFYFNPMAELDGVSYELQPLGTEGQFLPGEAYPEPYQRFQFSIPFSGGIKLQLNPFGSITLELGTRKTFTDYLDDAGGQYPDLEVLAEQDPTAARLSNRTPEYLGVPFPRETGSSRAGPNFKDWYGFGGISIALNLVQDAEKQEEKNKVERAKKKVGR